ncbi:MAG: TIGR03943 family protein [Cytobacillus gottheilii]|uniref:TIGR03943 family putative permease subunit n=1 Tax=Cytobacillus gottheilii TaxID=859144 RepID=UPI00082F5D9F|nr:TIGR03943 family protein [Cytobacillus gottheilii]
MNSEVRLAVSFRMQLQGIILISISLVIFKLYLTGNMAYIMAPKMMPFVLFAFIVLLLLGMYRLFRSNKEEMADCYCLSVDSHKSSWKEYPVYGVFLASIILSFVTEDFQLNAASLANRGIISSVSPDFADEVLLSEIYNEETKRITVNDDNYFKVMQAMNSELDQLIGVSIQIQGFIYRESEFNEDEAVIARQSMTCCVADSSVYGYMLEGEVQKLPTGEWYDLEGTIQKGSMDGIMMPVISISSINKIETPQEVFLYE